MKKLSKLVDIVNTGILLIGIILVLSIGWLAFEDWMFRYKRAQYCEQITVQQSVLTDEGKTRNFYACTF